ncbi:MAG: VWA domain-containing protein [Pyrinomonadaceae bacterium]|nr:VWA domain-containing protein [Pyrinomonadaceae bacterium]
MKTVVRSSLFVAMIVLCALHAREASAQGGQTAQPATSNPTASQQDQELDSQVFIREVRVPITVLDKKKEPVVGLTVNDFLILEDKQPQQIVSFTNESQNQPLYIGVLMDTSSSTAGKLRFEKEAALNFIHTVARLRKDQVAFVTFDDEVRLLQDFTTRLDLLDKAVNNVKKPGNHTALYDAVWQICDEKMRSIPGRRALVVITDGDDTYSRATLANAIDIAQRTETVIFAISTKAGFSGSVPGVEAGQVADRGDRDLEKLCEETGGRAFFTGDILALERSFTRVAREMRSQYIATYRPTNNRYDGSSRRIEVKLANKGKGMKVTAKSGYTAIADGIR